MIAHPGLPQTRTKSTQAPRGSSSDEKGRSDCEPLREVIEKKLDLGLQAKRIHQDLAEEHGFRGMGSNGSAGLNSVASRKSNVNWPLPGARAVTSIE